MFHTDFLIPPPFPKSHSASQRSEWFLYCSYILISIQNDSFYNGNASITEIYLLLYIMIVPQSMNTPLAGFLSVLRHAVSCLCISSKDEVVSCLHQQSSVWHMWCRPTSPLDLPCSSTLGAPHCWEQESRESVHSLPKLETKCLMVSPVEPSLPESHWL